MSGPKKAGYPKDLLVLGIIPARGGSKGVLRKNARPLCGKPLLSYTCEAALASRRLSRVVLSTDDLEIAEIGSKHGVEIPFLRPAELAQDDTPMLPVVQHAVGSLEESGQRFDAICLLQPTNPLRLPEDIDFCIDLLEQNDADAVVTVLPVPTEHHPYWVYLQNGSGFLHLSTGEENPIPSRQQLPLAFHREGSVYVTRRDVVMNQNSLYGKRLIGHQLDAERSVNIDSPADWERAEEMMTALSSRN